MFGNNRGNSSHNHRTGVAAAATVRPLNGNSRQRRVAAATNSANNGYHSYSANNTNNNNNEDTMSVIKGLDTYPDSNLVAIVRRLVAGWRDPKCPADLIDSVERNTTSVAATMTRNTSKANLFVTAVSREANRALLAGAQRHLNSDHFGGRRRGRGGGGTAAEIGVKWLPYRSSSDNRRDKDSRQWDDKQSSAAATCKSVIKGLNTKHVHNLTGYVRQMVNKWNDRTVNGRLIKSVEINTRNTVGGGGGHRQLDSSKVNLFVTAVSRQASRSLVMAAKRNGCGPGIVWTKYMKHEDNNSITSGGSPSVMTNDDSDDDVDGDYCDNSRQSGHRKNYPHNHQVPSHKDLIDKLNQLLLSTTTTTTTTSASHSNTGAKQKQTSIGKHYTNHQSSNNCGDNSIKNNNNHNINNNINISGNNTVPNKTMGQLAKNSITNYCQLCRNWIAINDGQQFDGTAAAATASSGCRHVYCRECLAQYLDSQITDGTVHHIKCPDRQCSGEAAYELVCRLLSRKSLVRYHKLLLIKTLDTIEDTAYCPKCNDSVEIDSSRKYGYCLGCDYAFCACCRLGYHGSQSACSIGTGATDKDVQPGDKQRRLVNGNSGRSPDGLHESVNFIRAHYKKCPNCGFTCEKINGCNNMQCKMCMIHFCWLCLMDITNNETRVIHYLTTNCKLNTI